MIILCYIFLAWYIIDFVSEKWVQKAILRLAQWLVTWWDDWRELKELRRMIHDASQPDDFGPTGQLSKADLEKIAKMIQSDSAPTMPSRQIIIDGFSTLSPAGKRSIKRAMGCVALYSQNHGEFFSFTIRK